MRAVADDHGKTRPTNQAKSTGPDRPVHRPHVSSLPGLQRAAGNRAVGQLIAGSRQRAEPAAEPVVQVLGQGRPAVVVPFTNVHRNSDSGALHRFRRLVAGSDGAERAAAHVLEASADRCG